MGWFPDQVGGLNRHLRELSAAVCDHGWDARALVIGPASDAPTDTLVVSTTGSPLLYRLLGVYGAARRLGLQVDVVDSHFALYGAGPIIFGAFRDKPLVVHFQGPWAAESEASGHPGPWLLAMKHLLESAVYRRADAIIVLSAAFKRILVDGYGIPPWHINVIPPGVDLEHFRPGSRSTARLHLGLPEDAWIGLTVRRLVPRMGIDVLIEAWTSFTSSWGGDALLVVTGEGPSRSFLENQAAAAGIESKVRFLGRVSDDDLVACYQAADVCVVPSTALEGFGLVVLESLACGTPVIASDSGGLPEALAALDPSLVVPSGDPGALSRRLTAAAAGSSFLPSGNECRVHAEGFSWPHAADRTIDIYERVRTRRPERHRARIVYLDHCAKLSGGELSLAQLLPSLTEVDVHVILGEEGPLEGLLLRRGISVEVLPMGGAARELPRDRVRPGRVPVKSLAHTLVYVWRLSRRLKRLRPDMVQTNSLKSTLVGGAAARVAGIALVAQVREPVSPETLPPAAVRIVRFATRWIPKAVIANSQATLDSLCLPAEHLARVVSPAVDIDLRHRSATRHTDEPLRIGIVGRLAPLKGQHLFLAAISRAFPDGPEQAVIVGSPMFGEEGYRNELLDFVEQHGLHGRVLFTGFREDVAAEMACLDILVCASIVPEGFGRVIIEGMAVGLPVVAPACGGPLELIEDGTDGLLYPPGDVEALAGALRRLAGDPDLRRRLGEAGRLKARRFQPEQVAAEMHALYRSILGSDE